MNRIEVITIAGNPGSGKSTTARGVAEMLGFDHFSSGDMFREIAKEQGMDVLQANVSAEDNYDIDRQVDQHLKDIAADESQHKTVIDSRMAWHWMPESFKVYLNLPIETAAQRIIDSTDDARLAAEDIPLDSTVYAQQLQARQQSEARRYRQLYGVDPYDPDNYDLVIDTNVYDINTVVDLVVTEFKGWLEGE